MQSFKNEKSPAFVGLVLSDKNKEFYFPALHIRILVVSASLQMNGRDSSGCQTDGRNRGKSAAGGSRDGFSLDTSKERLTPPAIDAVGVRRHVDCDSFVRKDSCEIQFFFSPPLNHWDNCLAVAR